MDAEKKIALSAMGVAWYLTQKLYVRNGRSHRPQTDLTLSRQFTLRAQRWSCHAPASSNLAGRPPHGYHSRSVHVRHWHKSCGATIQDQGATQPYPARHEVFLQQQPSLTNTLCVHVGHSSNTAHIKVRQGNREQSHIAFFRQKQRRTQNNLACFKKYAFFPSISGVLHHKKNAEINRKFKKSDKIRDVGSCSPRQ